MFLADVASFKRGTKTLLEYKNELKRLMNTYQPDLKDVPTEFERQATTRFIEGLDDDELKRKLRRYCKRDKLNLDAAYQFTLDYESSNLQTRIREGEAAAIGRRSLAYVGPTQPKVQLATNGSGEVRQMQEDIKGLAAKRKIAEMRIQELAAKSAHTNDRLDIVAKEVGQVAVNMTKLEKSMDSQFEHLERVITQGQNIMMGQSRPQYNPNTYNATRGYRGGFPRGFSARGYGVRGVAPSITGGPGFVRNDVQPTQWRPLRPAATTASDSGPVQVAPLDSVSNPTHPLAATAPIDESSETQNAPEMDRPHAPDVAGWWSPAMQLSDAAGYDEAYDTTLSYGGADFLLQ